MPVSHGLHAADVYHGSDGAVTRQYYRLLLQRGRLGEIAVALFRAQKSSRRAKKYGPYAGINGRSYRDLSYERKQESLAALCTILSQYGTRLGFRYGWGTDPGVANPHVLYVDIPSEQFGQVSFHSPTRGAGPDYPDVWDGIHGASEQRILAFCDAVALGRRDFVPDDTAEQLTLLKENAYVPYP